MHWVVNMSTRLRQFGPFVELFGQSIEWFPAVLRHQRGLEILKPSIMSHIWDRTILTIFHRLPKLDEAERLMLNESLSFGGQFGLQMTGANRNHVGGEVKVNEPQSFGGQFGLQIAGANVPDRDSACLHFSKERGKERGNRADSLCSSIDECNSRIELNMERTTLLKHSRILTHAPTISLVTNNSLIRSPSTSPLTLDLCSNMPVSHLVSLTITTVTIILSIYLRNKHVTKTKRHDITLWLHSLCSGVLPILSVLNWIFDLIEVLRR